MNTVLDKPDQPDTLLSIVTVTRNDADRLSKTILSLGQFYGDPRFEHIVMDGLSTDDTASVVARLASTANFQFHSGADKGIYDAMNQGIKKSKGRFLLFLNCGDCMLATPDDIANWIGLVANGETSDIICFAFSQVESGGATKTIPARTAEPYSMPTSHQAMLFSADFVNTHSYNIEYKIAADYDLYLRSRPHCVAIAPVRSPLTAVEVDGVASSSPTISYREYLAIASRNLTGMRMLMCMLRIGCKAFLVIAAKSLLPQKWISKLRAMA